MKQIKIIFFDIDGTLIDMNKKKISKKVLEALIRLKENGIKICVATGRPPMQVPRFPNVEFDVFLTYNGSYCFDKDQDIFSNPLKREDVYTIINNAGKIGRPLSLATKTRLVSNGTDQDLSDYYEISGQKVKIADDFDAVADGKEIYQIMLGCRKGEYDAVMKDVKEAKIAAWWDQAMAFGDGNNDIEMLKMVGRGVAMGNTSMELKAAADDVCGDVAEDGIYSYLNACGLI